MAFDEVLARVIELLARQGWASYQTLKRRFHLDEETIAALKRELIEARQVAVDEAGTRLIWRGELRPVVAPIRQWEGGLPTSSPVAPPRAAHTAPSAAGGAQSPRAGDSSRRPTQLVGREQEVELLRARWAQVQAGQGQVVGLSGEAGIGKSHLAQVITAHVTGTPHVRWECRCAPYYQHSAFYPIIDLFQRACQFQPEDSPDAKLYKLETTLASYAIALPEVVPLLAALLSVPLGDRYLPLTLSPQRQKQWTLEAVWALVQTLAAQRPVVLIVEDLHWADPSTLELLSLLVAQAPTARLYVLLTWRPEFRPPWTHPTHLTSLTLPRLLPAQVIALAKCLAGGKPLPPAVLQQIVEKTEGVPLFVEELTKMVLESGLVREGEAGYELTGPLPPLAIPTTLEDSLRARLEGLGVAKAVAQVGAVWGRGFTEAQLQAVMPLDRRQLAQALARLVAADIVQEVNLPPCATYVFKHALLQEVAYASLPQPMRQQVHQGIAQAMAERFPETVESQLELLAHHYTEAGLSAQAIPYWQRAGQRAIQRSAPVEAVNHLTKGLELLRTFPDTPERAQQELVLQTTIGPALIATKGYAAPEVEQAYARARVLCRQVGDTPQLFPVLFGLRLYYQQRAAFQTARELEVQLFHLAQRAQAQAFLLMAHQALGATSYWLGEFAQARVHLEQGLALYDPQQHRALTSAIIQNPGVTCLAFVARALWMLGYPDQALQRSQDALARARELAHPFSLAYALSCAAMLHQLRQEGPATQVQAEAAMDLSHEQGFALWWAMGAMLRGWVLVAQGQQAEGLAQLHQGLVAYRVTGTEVAVPCFLALLAETYGKGGQVEESLSILAEALAVVHKTGERVYEAELYRLKGELRLALSQEHQAEAETCFQQALDIARRQQAKSLELRAATSLSRLWQRQGKRDAARQLLAEIYGWFTEGFDTADLQEAKMLLEELS